jgi:hypothetical protein
LARAHSTAWPVACGGVRELWGALAHALAGSSGAGLSGAAGVAIVCFTKKHSPTHPLQDAGPWHSFSAPGPAALRGYSSADPPAENPNCRPATGAAFYARLVGRSILPWLSPPLVPFPRPSGFGLLSGPWGLETPRGRVGVLFFLILQARKSPHSASLRGYLGTRAASKQRSTRSRVALEAEHPFEAE